jgi:hypothetical protein
MIEEQAKQETNRSRWQAQLLPVSYLDYSSTLKMEATSSSEMSGSLRTLRRYSPEDRTLP